MKIEPVRENPAGRSATGHGQRLLAELASEYSAPISDGLFMGLSEPNK
jgi:hypothetical protein